MANIITSIPTVLSTGDETSVYLKNSETSFDLAVTVAGTNDARPSMNCPVTPTLVATNEVTLTFNAVVNAGTPIFRSYHNGNGTTTLNQVIVDGVNTVNILMEGTRDNITMYYDGRNTFDIDVTNYNAELPAVTTVEVEWIDSISAAATGNKIYRDDVEIADIAMGVQTYQDTTAETGTEYKYEVQAYSATDETTQEVLGVNVQYITTA